MKPKMYNLVRECVSNGLIIGWNRAHKHDDNPTMDYIMRCLEEGIMYEFHEIFDFDYKIE